MESVTKSQLKNKPRHIQRFFSLLSISMLLLFTAWMVLPSMALVEVEVEIDNSQSYYCAQQLTVLGDQMIADYSTFLDSQTRDLEDNSDKLSLVMTYYRYVVGTLEDNFEVWIYDDLTGESLSSSTDEYQHCSYIRDYYTTVADSMLHTFYIASTSSKTTFQVVDGLKAMNSEMMGLSDRFHASFPSMFNKFDNAFPCYVKSCVGR